MLQNVILTGYQAKKLFAGRRSGNNNDNNKSTTTTTTKRKRICKIVDFAVSADHRIKLKECEKKDKYLDFARELKKLWNMKVTIMAIECQSGAGSNGNEGVFRIPQSLSITGASLSDCLASYNRTLIGGGCPTPLMRCSQCILQPHPAGQYTELNVKTVLFQIIQFGISTLFSRQNSSISSNSV